MPTLTNTEFMDIVHGLPILYNKSSKLFRRQDLKINAWEEVAKASELSVSEAQTKYNTIRRSISEYLRGKKKSGSGQGDREVDKEIEAYQWMFCHIKHR